MISDLISLSSRLLRLISFHSFVQKLHKIVGSDILEDKFWHFGCAEGITISRNNNIIV